jgi:hypothetical protein
MPGVAVRAEQREAKDRVTCLRRHQLSVASADVPDQAVQPTALNPLIGVTPVLSHELAAQRSQCPQHRLGHRRASVEQPDLDARVVEPPHLPPHFPAPLARQCRQVPGQAVSRDRQVPGQRERHRGEPAGRQRAAERGRVRAGVQERDCPQPVALSPALGAIDERPEQTGVLAPGADRHALVAGQHHYQIRGPPIRAWSGSGQLGARGTAALGQRQGRRGAHQDMVQVEELTRPGRMLDRRERGDPCLAGLADNDRGHRVPQTAGHRAQPFRTRQQRA